VSDGTCKTCPSCGSTQPYRRGHHHPGLLITHCHALMGNHQAVTPCYDSWHTDHPDRKGVTP
jgi:hypothetical protein